MTTFHDRGPDPMTDLSLRRQSEALGVSKGADFAIEPTVVSGCYPRGAIAECRQSSLGWTTRIG